MMGLESDLVRACYARPIATPLEPYRRHIASMIFEFGTIAKSTLPDAGGFIAVLETFLEVFSTHFRHAVEIRNPGYLVPDYRARRPGVSSGSHSISRRSHHFPDQPGRRRPL
jgi:hypothetical protein